METDAALRAFAALASEHRLAVYRLLVRAGPDGMTVGEVAAALGLANATLSFHLKSLVEAGLVMTRQQGRHIHCSADLAHMKALTAFLTENCCGGKPC
ncbi:MAG: ArsR/SmtB family transcription factor [Pseudomonadota bacterium]